MPTQVMEMLSSNGNGEEHRFNLDNDRQYNIKTISQKHREMIRRLLLGQSNIEIAEALDVTPQTVSNVKNSPIVQEKLEHMQTILDAETLDVSVRIQQLSHDAVAVYQQLLHSPNSKEETKRMVAKDVLDKAGYKAPDKHLHAHMTGEQIDEIVRRGKEQGVVTRVEEAEILTEEEDNG